MKQRRKNIILGILFLMALACYSLILKTWFHSPEPKTNWCPPHPEGFSHVIYSETSLRLEGPFSYLFDGHRTYVLNLTQYETDLPYLQSYSCETIIEYGDYCQKLVNKPLLILAIRSQPENFHKRAALRETWAQQQEIMGFLIKPLFLIAATTNVKHMILVVEEAKNFNDILQWDFPESPAHLSLKERCLLEWLFLYCSTVDFIYKGDDTSFVNVGAIIKYLRESPDSQVTVHGNIQTESNVLRYGRRRISYVLFPYHKYPFFPAAGALIMPQSAITPLFEVSNWIPVFPFDDVYFGLLGLAANISYHHDDRFYVFGMKDVVWLYKEALVVCRMAPEKLKDVWQALQQNSTCVIRE
uniref:Hexosyltransferase n=1 Tax=Geotrypetes seraphini TaxID=260995 RepID=A0A6P8NX14_GEOSA|nr:N-acetyllactosaminide beta-1,3-N-acetylglucosaminyltransferase 3-like [Geotrypetes seraphini]XP_033780986.1 N-acetyllactosaminide beta-1,3-N-acetylglucosaminyltransferase 3-like [Geotrypetes seraphini]XP_033780987.1 N-acetyllactosaminide beta-1,3-N-acetylglucosaminyltransferase 3-like [Geotrypetes seraphini]XP_033780989.1 N-acetyllactosaminide beta-1,3-N-acetylglucosaminyltransferase 3-like [Geotrypetes seraphini]XP_033780990.1 N-acetyllactosaminide beta-1,3-N-acetylglucosaminyltransferase 3